MAEIAFHLRNVEVKHGNNLILHIPECTIQEGMITAIVGPSGSGKTTFLRVLNLLQKPNTGGQISLFHEDYFDKKGRFFKNKLKLQRKMGFVFQKPAMFETSVYENVAAGLKYRKWSKQHIDQQVQWALELVKLKDRHQQMAHALSGGEQQRIALARTIVTEPQVLLLDEATANLDPANVRIIEDVLKSLHEQLDMTLIMVTHNLQQAERLAEHCMFMYDGSILESVEAKTFFQQPSHPLLRQFLTGEMVY